MSKRNNQSSAPIEFRVSENIDGRGARIPVAVNRPGWKYASYNSKPTVYEWILIVLAIILIAALITALIISAGARQVWALSFCLVFPLILWIISAASRMFSPSKEAYNGPSKNQKKKKPKHRKDYK